MISETPFCPKCGEELVYPDNTDACRSVEVFCCSCLSTVLITERMCYETELVEE